ncbi:MULTISPECIES: terminase small subunit [unclassified Rhizobium]|uniref:hypothetical protein n=1 Tax=unclassified Rhizobium TaxID=2613769 RepID=UPI001ADBEE70|nr:MULTISPECIES: hypothetical protein [unclassified Rhizobium]MBO9122798.1 hypothetical protein [Rhizobium sp. 16-488-2b]MBO9173330.1 hypothetical protein [Rhizobium sp. 16-488-2a]
MVKHTSDHRMSVLANPRHEAFAQAVASGKSATEAYAVAGFKPHQQNASRLMLNDVVRARVAEIQALGVERALVSIESLTDELEVARVQAMASGRYAAAVSAILGKAKLHNLLKADSTSPQSTGLFTFDGSMLDDLTDDEMDLLERVALRIGLMVQSDQMKPRKVH